jgi:hypothetical protein
MVQRKGLGKGLGSGYRNLPSTFSHDRRTHSLSAKGIKSPQRIINVNFSNLSSIKKSEKIKQLLENQGFNLIKTRQTGFDKFQDVYQKGGKKTNYHQVWEIDKDPEFQLVNVDIEAEGIKDILGKDAKDYDIFFIKEKDGEIIEAYGMVGTIPYLERSIDKIKGGKLDKNLKVYLFDSLRQFKRTQDFHNLSTKEKQRLMRIEDKLAKTSTKKQLLDVLKTHKTELAIIGLAPALALLERETAPVGMSALAFVGAEFLGELREEEKRASKIYDRLEKQLPHIPEQRRQELAFRLARMKGGKLKQGQKFHVDTDFEGERLVDDIVVEESRKGKEVLVYSPRLRAYIFLPKKELKGGKGLTKAQRYNKRMDNIFAKAREIPSSLNNYYWRKGKVVKRIK